MANRDKWIRASEVGEFVYCARAFHLRTCGVEATANREARVVGSRFHAAHAALSVRIERVERAARFVFLAAVLVGAVAAATWYFGHGR